MIGSCILVLAHTELEEGMCVGIWGEGGGGGGGEYWYIGNGWEGGGL